ncbi:catalase-domain-containing protein [Choiromyces venosus 120613-1]|uniref:Catalase n=1 Tax=Choiromyces venosus 120613-1 TaxID=1336337 RepID=A0A3N4JXW3_9PEZI|nr:catalase-domain-containing protein [Choiromyces venosus 120613-1]
MKTAISTGLLLLNAVANAACPYMDGGASLHKRGGESGGSSGLPGDDGYLDRFYVEDGKGTYTTTDFGTRVDDTHSLKAGERGPTLLEDFVLRTKITKFDHERVPERAVHARGAAAHGYFESYGDYSNITSASFLGKGGKKTPIFLRFSTVAGSRGSADTVRDVHGFALRFYTDEGNYDIVGNSIPVFFIQDAIQFPDLIHSVKPRPDNEIPQAATAHDSAWDFFGQNPSALHTLLWALSGHGIPRSFRHMDGFGVHTFRFVNDAGKSKLVKYHFKTKQGLASLVWAEALVLNGQNSDFHRQDLFDAIDSKNYPEWEVGVQIMDESDVLRFGFDLNDPTKIVPVEMVPITPIGKFVLNRNTKNYFAETEQAMFNPGHVVRGIDFSDDPLLQGRLFSYVDTQINRHGGPNFEQLPINQPHNGVHNNHRDGAGQNMIHLNTAPYTFNTLNEGFPKPATQNAGRGHFTAPARKIIDANYVRNISPTFLDYWSQPRLFFQSLGPAEQQMVVNAARFELSKVSSEAVRKAAIAQFNKISNDLAKRVAMALGMTAPAPDSAYYHNNKTSGVATFGDPLPTIKTLNVGILTTTTSPAALAQAASLAKAFKGKGAMPKIVAEYITAGVDMTYSATDAVLFDGVIVVDGTASLFSMTTASSMYPPQRPASIVRDAFLYGKPVAAVGTGKSAFDVSTIACAQDGVYCVDNNGVNGLPDTFEGGLKTFKFLGRFPIDA